MKQNILKSLPAFFCMLLWSMTFVAAKYLLLPASPIDPLPYLNADELTIGVMVITYLSLWAACPFAESPHIDKNEMLMLIGGFAGIFGGIYLTSKSVVYGDTISTGIICTALPMSIAPLASAKMRNQKFTTGMILGFLLVLAGIFVLIRKEGFNDANHPEGNLFALGGSVCLTIAVVILQHIKCEHQFMPLRKSVFYGIIAFAIFALIKGKGETTSMGFSHMSEIDFLLPFFYIGIASLIAVPALWTFTKKATYSNLPYYLLYLMPIAIIGIGFGIEHEHLTRYAIVGGFWIIAGLCLAKH